METKNVKMLIIGSGAAGYTAAIYAARAMLSPVVISGEQPGGQMTITTDVENYPGFAKTIQGPWLMEEMKNQAKNVGAKIIDDIVIDVDISSRPFIVKTHTQVFAAEVLIIATGAQAKWLGLEVEEAYKGFGVSACATCDGFFYKGKDVLVIGGGNTAVEEALYLANLASSVKLVHRRDSLRAESILQQRLLAKENVEVIWDSELVDIKGKQEKLMKKVESAVIKNVKTGKVQNINVEGIFIAIGHSPCVELFKGKLRLKDSGYLYTKPNSTATEVAGIFAAGDVTDDIYRQAITAAGQGCMAALDGEKFLQEFSQGKT